MNFPTSRRIELRHLRYFLAVFEELHFSRAAERLHLAQPPLSQAIRQLERELGVQLLDRTTRVVTPTEAGSVFAAHASSLLANLDMAVEETRRAAGLASGLRIGCIPSLPIERLLRFLQALRERNPHVATPVTHLPSVEQLRRLRRFELDVGVFHHAEAHDELEIEPLFHGEPLRAFLARGHRLARNQILRPDDLQDEILVMFARSANPPLYDRLLALIHGAGYRFRDLREARVLQGSDLILAIATEEGVTLLPASLSAADEAGALAIRRPLDPPLSMPDTVVAWRADAPAQLESFLAGVRTVARALYRPSDPRAAEH